MKTKGKVYLVGGGPGDPELISLKALRCLKEADAVIYDRLINPALLQYAPPKAKIIYAGKSPYGERGRTTQKHTLSQDEINSLLVKKAKQGKTVARLKCGDPFLFGRGAEEALFLSRHKVPFEIVPGISSALAVPAYAGIPLSHRNYTSSIGIFTGHEEKDKTNSAINWPKISTGLGTLVFLMGVENLSFIVKNLLSSGRPKSTPCCLIQEGTTPRQKTVTANLGTIVPEAKQAKIRPPALLVVGEVVSLRKRLDWFENKPLFGKKILITRPMASPRGGPAEEKNRLAQILEEYCARCIELPAIEIKPLTFYGELDSAIKNISNFNWLIFSSQNAVKFFKERLTYLKKDLNTLNAIKIAAIGPNTKMTLENLGLKVTLEPKEFCQEGLLEAFKKINIRDKNILIARCLQARNVLPQGLEQMGAKVKIAPAYQTTINHQPSAISKKILTEVDIITFTSAFTVKSFFAAGPKKTFKRIFSKTIIASIGPITSQEVTKRGFKVTIEAKKYTFEGLAEAIAGYYHK